jgi:hypothetical protein
MDTNLIIRLYNLRQACQAMQAEREAAEAEIAASELGQKLQRAVDKERIAHELLAKTDAEIREAALSDYAATGEKKVAPGVSVKTFTRVDWNDADLLPWLQEHAPMYVVQAIDKKGVNKAAKELAEHKAPIEITTDPKPYIDGDLWPVVQELVKGEPTAEALGL